jgi:hypothetical protein
MKNSRIPIEEWFVFKPEALKYLNKVASEIRLMSSGDPYLERLVDSFSTRCVKYFMGGMCKDCGYSHGRQFEFRFDMDGGRPFKGHLYCVRHRSVWRAGSLDGQVFLDTSEKDLDGQTLLDAIREIVVQEVWES